MLGHHFVALSDAGVGIVNLFLASQLSAGALDGDAIRGKTKAFCLHRLVLFGQILIDARAFDGICDAADDGQNDEEEDVV